MSLAFALMAAINGSTGSSATLSHGLQLPHHASPTSTRRHQGFSSIMGGGARGRPGRCRANQTACTNLIKAVFADLVRAHQAGRAGLGG
jgi:hypothetical protein